MHSILKQGKLSDSTTMFFQMRYHLPRLNLPNSHITLTSTSADKFQIRRQNYRWYLTFMGVIYSPQRLAVVNSIGSNLSIAPPRYKDLISKSEANRISSRCCEPCINLVLVSIPESNCSICTTSSKSLGNTRLVIRLIYCICMILVMNDLRAITWPNSMKKSFVCWDKQLNSIGWLIDGINTSC